MVDKFKEIESDKNKEHLNRELIILKCSSLLGKIAANRILSNEEIKELSNELFTLAYSNEEYNEQEEKMVGHKINRNGVEYAIDLEQFYNEKLKKYESYIDLLNIQVNDIEKLPENYEKFIKLSTQLKIYKLDIDMEKYTEILFALLMNELTFFNTQSILDSLSDTDILLITEYIKKQLPESSELHTRLEKDIIDKEELHDILNTFSKEKKYFGNIDFKTYNEAKKKELEERLEKLSKDRIATIKAIESYQTISDLGRLEKINNEIDELYSLEKEQKQKLKKRMIKKVIANCPSKIKFDFSNVDFDIGKIADTAHVALFVASVILSFNKINTPDYSYTNKTEKVNTLDYQMESSESKIKSREKITSEEAIPEMKLSYCTPWIFNGTEYQREVIRYSVKDIDFENLEDYLNIDIKNLQVVEKEIEKATKLDENSLYTEDYIEIEKNEILTGEEEANNFYTYLFRILAIFGTDFILTLIKAFLDENSYIYFDDSEAFAIGSLITIFKELSYMKVKIDKKETITQEDIDKLKISINRIEKRIEKKLKEKENIQNSEQKIKELQTKLEAIDKLLLAFNNPEMIYTVNPGEHVYESPKEEKEEGYALGV